MAILCHERGRPAGPWPRLERRRLRRLVALGLPAATQVSLEFGVFAVVTALAGRLEAATLAAHQIVLNVASATFMVPQGVGSAGAVRVGYSVGRRDPSGVRRSGWAALTLGAGFMSGAAVLFVLAPHPLLRLFTTDPAVTRAGVTLLLVAAFFQLFDGLQAVATGVLRGLGDTRTPMLWNLAGHWVLGLPAGYLLCFVAGWGHRRPLDRLVDRTDPRRRGTRDDLVAADADSVGAGPEPYREAAARSAARAPASMFSRP